MSYRGNTYHPVAQFHNGTINEFTIEFHRFWREKKNHVCSKVLLKSCLVNLSSPLWLGIF